MAIKLRPVRPAGWWYDLVLLAAGVGLTTALAGGYLLDLDLAVRDWVDAHRPPAAEWIALVLNFLGQGGWVLVPVSSGLALALAWRIRDVWPVLPVAGAFLLTGATIGPVKLWLDRGYPHNTALAHPEELFSDPAGTAYPSGHVANAIVWYGVISLLLGALLAAYGRSPLGPVAGRLLRVGPPAIVFCTTTYLGHHWITDSVAGLLLGLLLDRLLARIDWRTGALRPRRRRA